MQALDHAVETEHGPGAHRHQVDQHAGINQVELHDVVHRAVDVREVHVREVIGEHQHHAEHAADTNQQSGDQRQANEKVAPFHREGGVWLDARCREEGEHIVERLGVRQEGGDGPMRVHDLPGAGVEECPAERQPEVDDQPPLQRCVVHCRFPSMPATGDWWPGSVLLARTV
jgi:hypothetical protein